MENPASRMVHVPKGVPVVRYNPPAHVEVPVGAELPLIAKDSAPDKKLQEVWSAGIKIFNLGDPPQMLEYTAIWQRITDKHAVMCEHRVDFHEGVYTALLRWADISYKLPKV